MEGAPVVGLGGRIKGILDRVVAGDDHRVVSVHAFQNPGYGNSLALEALVPASVPVEEFRIRPGGFRIGQVLLIRIQMGRRRSALAEVDGP
jgi:hypothetical protein